MVSPRNLAGNPGNRVLVLGGGMGGLAAANHLRKLLPSEHRIVVVEKKSTFYMCSFNMRIVAGEMGHPREGERDLSGLASKGIDWVPGEVQEIDPVRRRVRTSSGTLEGDFIIIALGADKSADAVPGFAQSAHNLYDAEGALGLRRAVENFDGGRVLVLVCSAPFSCPAAPYEAAFLMESAFRTKGNRGRVEIAIYTPEPRPTPSAGPEMSQAVLDMLKEHHIEYYPQQKLHRIEGEARRVVLEKGEPLFDLLVGIPPHRAPQVVREAGLTDDTGWVPVDLQTLETRYSGVFAIGDVTAIRQPNPTGMFLPKAWVFAEEEGRVVAHNIAAQLRGEEKSNRFDGKGFCYIEVGEGLAAYGSGDFYAYPTPRVYLEPPSSHFHEERKGLEMERLGAWV